MMRLLSLTLLLMQRSAPGGCRQLQGLAAAAVLQRGVKRLLLPLVMLLGVLATAVVALLLTPGVHQLLLLLLLLLLVQLGRIHGMSLSLTQRQQLMELAPCLHSSSSSRRNGAQQQHQVLVLAEAAASVIRR
jgi:hypothetical protein